jgi:CIC family chloride channel protein
MTGNIEIIAPAMVAVALATFIVRRFDDSIYRSQLRSRADSAASQLRTGLTLIDVMPVSEAAAAPPVLLRAGTAARAALAELRAGGIIGAPVADANGIYLGTVTRDHLFGALEVDPEAAVDGSVDPAAGTVAETADLGAAIDALTQAGGQWVTVTDGQRRVTGVLTAGAVVRAYRRAQGTLAHDPGHPRA